MREEGASGAKAQVGRVPAQNCRIWAGDAQGEVGSSPLVLGQDRAGRGDVGWRGGSAVNDASCRYCTKQTV